MYPALAARRSGAGAGERSSRTRGRSTVGATCRSTAPLGRATGEPHEWVVEVKMGRFLGDNGKPDDTGVKDLLSPFRADRSALSDAPHRLRE